MFAIAALLTIVTISVVITRVASLALVATGVSGQLAQFQARSAFTGVGFTTTESEAIVDHPVRRRIALILMLLGNGGIVTVVASLVLGFSEVASFSATMQRVAVLASGLLVLWALTATPLVNRSVERAIERALVRWTDLHVRDYVRLLDLSEGYAVHELDVNEGSWLAERTLRELDLTDEGVLVLGLRRPTGEYLGAPDAELEIHAGDTVVLYGRQDNLTELDRREAGPGGQRAHDDAVARQRQVQAKEQARDPAR